MNLLKLLCKQRDNVIVLPEEKKVLSPHQQEIYDTVTYSLNNHKIIRQGYHNILTRKLGVMGNGKTTVIAVYFFSSHFDYLLSTVLFGLDEDNFYLLNDKKYYYYSNDQYKYNGVIADNITNEITFSKLKSMYWHTEKWYDLCNDTISRRYTSSYVEYKPKVYTVLQRFLIEEILNEIKDYDKIVIDEFLYIDRNTKTVYNSKDDVNIKYDTKNELNEKLNSMCLEHIRETKQFPKLRPFMSMYEEFNDKRLADRLKNAQKLREFKERSIYVEKDKIEYTHSKSWNDYINQVQDDIHRINYTSIDKDLYDLLYDD